MTRTLEEEPHGTVVGSAAFGRVWVNLDLIWGAALAATGLGTPFLKVG